MFSYLTRISIYFPGNLLWRKNEEIVKYFWNLFFRRIWKSTTDAISRHIRVYNLLHRFPPRCKNFRLTSWMNLWIGYGRLKIHFQQYLWQHCLMQAIYEGVPRSRVLISQCHTHLWLLLILVSLIWCFMPYLTYCKYLSNSIAHFSI